MKGKLYPVWRLMISKSLIDVPRYRYFINKEEAIAEKWRLIENFGLHVGIKYIGAYTKENAEKLTAKNIL